jgi:hypothetical protein
VDTSYLILVTVYFAGVSFLIRKYEHLKGYLAVWLNLFSGGLAIYSIEIAVADQPIYLTALLALLLCLIPAMIEGLMQLNKAITTLKRKTLCQRPKIRAQVIFKA